MIPDKLTKTLLLTSAVTLASCSSLLPKNSSHIDKLTAENAYEEAVALYQKLSPEEQEKIDLEQLEQQRRSYEKQLLNSIKKKTRSNSFVEAQQQLDAAYRTMPSNESLQAVADELANRRNRYIDEYELKRNKQLAAFLAKEKPLLEKLLQARADDKEFQQLYSDRQSDRLELSETLGMEGLAAFEKRHYRSAKPLLQLAEGLQSDPRWKSALTTISKHEKSKQYQAAAAARKKQQAQQKKLQQAFDDALKDSDFNLAKRLLKKLKALKKIDPDWLSAAEDNLETRLQQNLESALKKGRALYSDGRIDMALKIWKRAQSYVPDNKELNDSIERAERFQQRYQQLKK